MLKEIYCEPNTFIYKLNEEHIFDTELFDNFIEVIDNYNEYCEKKDYIVRKIIDRLYYVTMLIYSHTDESDKFKITNFEEIKPLAISYLKIIRSVISYLI